MITVNFRVTENDVVEYANVSGDFNPIHFNPKYAQQQGFSKKVVHGMLTMTKIWGIISTELLKPQSILRKYSLSFLHPVYAGDQVTLHILQQENKIRFTGSAENKTVVRGTIIVGTL
ncbi:MaoC/PaaZ C-terminal domain-containing protein [Peribacillus sp. NPDC097295]|uniref:MaoC/PaaZ C-terminal domain-containing protein n=1 Tax=Peribacillus sp. NPDC097295 TaxID=3364402 RepID=UPI0037F14863